MYYFLKFPIYLSVYTYTNICLYPQLKHALGRVSKLPDKTLGALRSSLKE